MLRESVIIGARGSKLALWQANFIAEFIKKSGFEVETKKIKTKGDKILDSSLAKIGEKGLFVKEIEIALANREIDIAVHSMKDVPTEIPSGLIIGAVTKRDDFRDALVSYERIGLKNLPQGATIGTSSLRRRAQILSFRPDFNFNDLRGNLDTRLNRVKKGDFDAIILSSAGLDRLGLSDEITERISPDICLPGVGQGSIGVEIREDDEEIRKLVGLIDDRKTRQAIFAERALLKKLEGGCQIPIGALGILEDEKLKLTAMVANLDGKRLVRDSLEGSADQFESLGVLLAEKLLERGAKEILDEIRSQTGLSCKN